MEALQVRIEIRDDGDVTLACVAQVRGRFKTMSGGHLAQPYTPDKIAGAVRALVKSWCEQQLEGQDDGMLQLVFEGLTEPF